MEQKTFKKTMILTSDQLKRLNLKSGINHAEFSVTTSFQGTSLVEANIYLFDHMTKFVISDIDGTITK
jgi:phosphatidate phosphatase LPIN